MSYIKDLGTGIVDGLDIRTGYPVDKWGHLLDPCDPSTGTIIEGIVPHGTELYNLTSPYGFLEFAVGSSDDFWCFDYNIIESLKDPGKFFVILHAVVNSETGGFIDGAGYEVIPIEEYVYQASSMVDGAIEWCYENRVRHSKKGWNQGPYFFGRAVDLAVLRKRGIDVSKFSERQRRFGGVRICSFLFAHKKGLIGIV